MAEALFHRRINLRVPHRASRDCGDLLVPDQSEDCLCMQVGHEGAQVAPLIACRIGLICPRTALRFTIAECSNDKIKAI